MYASLKVDSILLLPCAGGHLQPRDYLLRDVPQAAQHRHGEGACEFFSRQVVGKNQGRSFVASLFQGTLTEEKGTVQLTLYELVYIKCF